MNNANYPLWYGLPRGVELRQDGKPAVELKTSDGLTLPWSIQFIGLLLQMLVGVGLVGAYFELVSLHPPGEELRLRFLASEAGIRFQQSGAVDYLFPTGVGLLLGGIYLSVRTMFLRHLGEADRFTKAFAFLYLAPGVTIVLVVGGAVVLMTGLLLLYVVLFFIVGALMLLGALFSAGS